MSFCECGCGEHVSGWNSHTQRPIRFKVGHHIKSGMIKPNYKYGLIFDGRYWKERVPDHPFGNSLGYVYLHRLVYERYYNCILLSYTDIHHKDDNRLNNDISNLQPCYRGQHNAMRYNEKRARDT